MPKNTKIIVPTVSNTGEGADRAIQEIVKHLEQLLQAQESIADQGVTHSKKLIENLLGKPGAVRVARIKPGLYTLEVKSKTGWHQAEIHDDAGLKIGNLVFK